MCAHGDEFFFTARGHYDREAKRLCYSLFCDGCDENMGEISSLEYEPQYQFVDPRALITDAGHIRAHRV